MSNERVQIKENIIGATGITSVRQAMKSMPGPAPVDTTKE